MEDEAEVPDRSVNDVVRRVLQEQDVEAEHALGVLVRTLVDRRVQRELRKAGRRRRRLAAAFENERPDALTAAFDAVFPSVNRGKSLGASPPGAGPVERLLPADPTPDQRLRHERVAVQQALISMPTGARFLAEREAGLIEDEDEDDDEKGTDDPGDNPNDDGNDRGGRPPMRLATSRPVPAHGIVRWQSTQLVREGPSGGTRAPLRRLRLRGEAPLPFTRPAPGRPRPPPPPRTARPPPPPRA